MSDTYAEHTAKRYEETVRRTAQSLRDVADDFEKRALDLFPGRGEEARQRTSAARRAFHTLMWGLANTSTERLISDAAEADEAEKEMRDAG